MSSSALLDRPAARGHDQQRRAAVRVETLDLTQALPPTSADGSLPRRADMRPAVAWRPRSIIPGFGLTLGLTLAWLGLIVMLPLVALFARAASLDAGRFIETVTSERVLAALQLSFGAALAAAVANAVFGTLLAWVLVRYRFPGRRLVDSLVDVPFALPTAVAGLALTALFSKTGWFGSVLEPLGLSVVYTPLGIGIAMAFTSIPFVVRTVQPVIEDLGSDVEEASRSLGASDLQILAKIIFPSIFPALLAVSSLIGLFADPQTITDFVLEIARAVSAPPSGPVHP